MSSGSPAASPWLFSGCVPFSAAEVRTRVGPKGPTRVRSRREGRLRSIVCGLAPEHKRQTADFVITAGGGLPPLASVIRRTASATKVSSGSPSRLFVPPPAPTRTIGNERSGDAASDHRGDDGDSRGQSEGAVHDRLPLSRSRSCQRRLRTGYADGRREGADVVRAVVAPAVYEEGGCAGDADQVGAVDVIGNAGGTAVVAQGVGEAFDVEAELLGVADQVARVERVLVIEQEVVHLPE